MDRHMRYSRKRVSERRVDELIGISRGMIADGVLTRSEVVYLMDWLIRCKKSIDDCGIIDEYFNKASNILSDNVITEQELSELFIDLSNLAGDSPTFDERVSSPYLPVDDPLPTVIFDDKTFCFTGRTCFGFRTQCQHAILSLGGIVITNISKKLDYLVIGTGVTESWMHQSYGRKIERAVEYRKSGLPLAIITEVHWVSAPEMQKKFAK